jgi:Ser/Thr protein kinase RdoA (MazF antagonist)
MSDFRRATDAEQIRHLDELAQIVAARFGIRPVQRELLQYERNAVYGLTDMVGARYVLRISADDGYAVAEQESELAWLRWLRVDGQPVPEPVAATDGELVLVEGSTHVRPRTCVVFRWLEGDLPAADVSERTMAELGAATARLHDGQRRFHIPGGFTRPTHDWASAIGGVNGGAAISEPHRALLERLSQRLHVELAELEHDPSCLLHGDLHRDNILVHPSGISFIDFEDCGWGHPLFDVASLLDSFRRRVVSRRDYPCTRAAFLEAYRPKVGSGTELTRQLCAFKAVRDAITLRFIASSRSESVQSWAPERITQLLRHISGYLEGEPARV